MLTQLLNGSVPSVAQAQGAVAFSRLGDGKPHNKTAAGTAGAPLEVLFCQAGSLEVEAPGRRAQAKRERSCCSALFRAPGASAPMRNSAGPCSRWNGQSFRPLAESAAALC